MKQRLWLVVFSLDLCGTLFLKEKFLSKESSANLFERFYQKLDSKEVDKDVYKIARVKESKT